jgi:hypothetical protein
LLPRFFGVQGQGESVAVQLQGTGLEGIENTTAFHETDPNEGISGRHIRAASQKLWTILGLSVTD